MTDYVDQIKFTGMVVTYNEERHLRACLNSLAFCEQLIIIDLGSTDSSVEVAREFGADIIHHERVSIVEQIRGEALSYARNDWIIFLDPDEVFPENIEDHLRSIIMKDSNVGVIAVPWKFYFKGKPLNYTIWGMQKTKLILFHKDRNNFTPHVHRGVQLLGGYKKARLSRKQNSFIKHFWVDSYAELVAKHWRYIKKEGEARYEQGERFSLFRLITETLSALKSNLFKYNGIRGGFRGIFLSIFYAWYVNMSLLSLYSYEKQVRRENK